MIYQAETENRPKARPSAKPAEAVAVTTCAHPRPPQPQGGVGGTHRGATSPNHNRTGQFTTGRANSQPVVVNWTVFGPPHGGIVLTIYDNAIKTNVHMSKPQLNFKKNGCELARLCAAAMWSVCRKTKAPINGFLFFSRFFY